MPTISMFYGIIVSMYFYDNDRHHFPHIHIQYAEHEAIFTIDGGKLIEGNIPIKVKNLVKAWIEIHYDELMANWKLAVNGQEIYKIDPLK